MSQLPNATGLDADIMQRIALHDPGNQYSIPYMWGTTGIGYNEEKVMAIDKKAPVDSWDIVFKPELAKKFKDCGISVLDAPTEVIGAVLAWLGKDPNSQDPADLKAAEDKLMAVRPYIRKIHSSQYIEDLANGDICLAVGWSGDILQARDRADEADQGVVIKYAIPKEGTIIWFDMLAIPADAKHPKNAHAFINYLLDPQVAANNSNYINYANGVAASLDLIDEGVKDDPGIYPSPEVKAKLFPDLAESEEFTRLVNRTWTKFSTGQ
jgi:putrescine transport system substrate-binding protein